MKLGWVEHNYAQGFCQWKPLAFKLGYFCGEDLLVTAHSPQLLPHATLPFEPHRSTNLFSRFLRFVLATNPWISRFNALGPPAQWKVG